MALSPLDGVSADGLPPGVPQVSWWVRCVSSVASCVAVSPVVRWLGNGLFRCGVRLCVVIYPQFFAVGGVVV